MSQFNTLDLSQLPAPNAIESLNFEAILDARMQKFLNIWNLARVTDPTLPAYDVQSLETDPAKILQEVDAYRETLIRARINDAVLATSLAYAKGADLDVIAANYQTSRGLGETDTALRHRAQLAFENLSIGGSYGGYAYRALSVAPAQIADVAIYGHEIAGVAKGEVRVVCLGATSDGSTDTALLALIKDKLIARDVRKVNDNINVMAATPVPYAVSAKLILLRGSDAASVVAAQSARLAAYVASRRVIGAFVSPAGIDAALGSDTQSYVLDVNLANPTTKIGGGAFDVPVCTSMIITWEYVS
jgi:phage-related baseplate assembly protein